MYYSTRLPVLQVFFGIFIKFFEKFLRYAESSGGCMSFQQSAWFLGKVVLFLQANRRESHCFVGAAHVRPAAVRQTTSCGKAAGRALVGAQRAPTVCKQTRSCGCLPRRGKHCSRPGFVPLNRGPTLTTPQCPAPTAQLGSSSASTRQPFSVAPTAPSLQWRYRAQSSPPLPSL